MTLPPGTKVRFRLPFQLAMMGLTYPREGYIKQYLPDYPDGPAYEVGFTEGDIPFACFKVEWVDAYDKDHER